MSTPQDENRSYLLRLWIPALVLGGLIGVLILAALTSGEPTRTVPIAVGVVITVIMFISTLSRKKRQIARMLQVPAPDWFLRSSAASMVRIPHGAFFAAANSATILALYGSFEEAERALEGLAWETSPPLVQAQGSAAHAVVAYARGAITDGLDYAVVAGHQAVLDVAAPGARTSELAFRLYRNLGLALAGRATDTTREELRRALAQLPLLGQILAAWGLAADARNNGAVSELETMQAFIKRNAPHFSPSVEAGIVPALRNETTGVLEGENRE